MKKSIYLFFNLILGGILGGCALLTSPESPPQQLWIDPAPKTGCPASDNKPKNISVFIADARGSEVLYTKNIGLRPTPHTLGAYEGVVWAMSPLRVLKSRLTHVLRSCRQLKSVTESSHLSEPPVARVSFYVDTFWIDYTLDKTPYASIQGTWSIRPETQGLFPVREESFAFKAPVCKLNQQGVFEAIEAVVDQWTRESALWVLKAIP